MNIPKLTIQTLHFLIRNLICQTHKKLYQIYQY
nr:MAG TPA: hypothetical protein [Caudoviricetes sp.]